MGIWINASARDSGIKGSITGRHGFLLQLEELGLAGHVAFTEVEDDSGKYLRFTLRKELAEEWAPDHDTTQLFRKLKLDTLNNADDLQREILLLFTWLP